MYSSPAIFPTFRRHLRIAYLAAFSLGLVLLTNQAKANTSTVPPQLLEWKTEVENAQATLSSKYGYKSAPKTLHAAFHKGGVIWAKRYSSSWGNWVYTDWDVARNLHKRTLRELKDSINLHRSGKAIPVNHWENLNATMAAFRTHNSSYTKLFRQRIDYDVKQALELDFKHDHELAKRAAVAAGNKALAEFHQTMMDHYAEQSEIWRKHGMKVSKQIRDIGYGKIANPTIASR